MKGVLVSMMAVGLLRTVAETSDYKSTSRYDDVIAFVRAAQQSDPEIRVETFATTTEGRALPLVIIGSGRVKPVVFIMANIHAGEVEGKEAALMLLRDLITTHRKLRKRMTILIAPIYNADGNEEISTTHRTTQVGPVNGVGIRENAEGLDLNRDYMKLESPEARGLVHNVLNKWDPLVTIDLHTTNGSYHGYQLTYSPPLNPNADSRIIDFERETLLPEIRERMKKRHGKETYYYGNFVDQLQPEKGWYTFDNRPRFGNNYAGLRNRFAILSEAYSYIDFRARVEVTYQFLHEILGAIDRHASKMMRIAAAADEKRPSSLGVRFALKPWKKDVPILWERATEALPGEGIENPETGSGANIVRGGVIVPVKMTDFGIFAATEKSDVPYAFVIDARATNVIENLLTHGITVERLNEPQDVRVQEFVVKSAKKSDKEFQKHHELTVEGKWKDRSGTLEAGTYIVRTDQPLGRLACYLLDPRSDDGLFDWNFFGDTGIARIMKAVGLDATVVSAVE